MYNEGSVQHSQQPLIHILAPPDPWRLWLAILTPKTLAGCYKYAGITNTDLYCLVILGTMPADSGKRLSAAHDLDFEGSLSDFSFWLPMTCGSHR